MSMNFSEFKRKLGAEPRSRDPEVRRARHSSPEFEQAFTEAERFETKLDRALGLPAPPGLIDDLLAIGQSEPAMFRRRWVPMALAASILVAVGATSLYWQMNPVWESVDSYLVSHYRHDGSKLVARADGSVSEDVGEILGELSVRAEPALAAMIGVIKYCPTPDGKGVHMVLNTDQGPVTLIYMPDTRVEDGETLGFDDVEALLVDLPSGSAAIIGAPEQRIGALYAVVHDAIVPLPARS
jgi:hypothetical protein